MTWFKYDKAWDPIRNDKRYTELLNKMPFDKQKAMQVTRGLALLGQDVGTSAVVRYQLWFGHDVNNLALVVIFNF